MLAYLQDVFTRDHSAATPKTVTNAQKPAETHTPQHSDYWGENGLSFGDLIDIINPLQHIPLVSDAYRRITGDEASEGSRIVGSTLFGGPIGLIGAVASAVMRQETGQDTGDRIIAAVMGDRQRSSLPSHKVVESPIRRVRAAPVMPVQSAPLAPPRELVTFPGQKEAYVPPIEPLPYAADDTLPWQQKALDVTTIATLPKPIAQASAIIGTYKAQQHAEKALYAQKDIVA